MAAAFNVVGALSGTAVAETVGKGLVDENAITQPVVLAGLLGAIFWNLLTWYYGIPSSSSHALIGGLVGSVWCHKVLQCAPSGSALWTLLSSKGVSLTLQALFLSPDCGLLGGFVLMLALTCLTQR